MKIDNSLIILGIIGILSFAAAYAGKWDIVGIVIGGGFALLKGGNNEKAPIPVTDTPAT